MITTETHTRQHRAIIDHKDLERLVAEAVAGKIGGYQRPTIGRKGVTFDVRFEEATEGSPPYRVGTKAVVTITEDLMPQTADGEMGE